MSQSQKRTRSQSYNEKTLSKKKLSNVKQIEKDDDFIIGRTYLKVAKKDAFIRIIADNEPIEESVTLTEIKKVPTRTIFNGIQNVKNFIFENKEKKYVIAHPLEEYDYFDMHLPDDVTINIASYLHQGGNRYKRRKTRKTRKNKK